VAIAAASTFGIIVFAHGASTDMTLCATLGGALLCLWRASGSEKHGVGWALGAAAFSGGAMLAKGLIGPLLVVLIGGIWWIWARPVSHSSMSRRLITFGAALGVFGLVSAIWYAPVWARHGDFFWQEFFVNHHFKRFTSNEYKHPQEWYFFLLSLWWAPCRGRCGFFPPRVPFRDCGLAPTPRRLSCFRLGVGAVPIAFFSISESKLPSYILPSFPALAIVAAEALARGALLPRTLKPKWVLLSGAGFMALVSFCFSRFTRRYTTATRLIAIWFCGSRRK
jgi:4-amino-4-deoxy-L-arabinose transferase-like glycosyltransferase